MIAFFFMFLMDDLLKLEHHLMTDIPSLAYAVLTISTMFQTQMIV